MEKNPKTLEEALKEITGLKEQLAEAKAESEQRTRWWQEAKELADSIRRENDCLVIALKAVCK